VNKTGARSTAREAALQLLYALEASGEPEPHVLANFWRETPGDPEGRPYAEALFSGTLGRLAEIDERIREASDNWRVERMSRVDRNVLRLGTYELMERSDVPRAVIIDEAIELAKRYGSEGSGKFVNGVLERVATELGRSDPALGVNGERP
jgi:transcription antitermination protein NusB